MKNVTEIYISVREAVAKKLLKEMDGVYVAYLLSIILKKMQHESGGGGHFNVNPDTVLVQKDEGETPKVKLIGEDSLEKRIPMKHATVSPTSTRRHLTSASVHQRPSWVSSRQPQMFTQWGCSWLLCCRDHIHTKSMSR